MKTMLCKVMVAVLPPPECRKDFVQAFLDHLVNWDFAAAQVMSS